MVPADWDFFGEIWATLIFPKEMDCSLKYNCAFSSEGKLHFVRLWPRSAYSGFRFKLIFAVYHICYWQMSTCISGRAALEAEIISLSSVKFAAVWKVSKLTGRILQRETTNWQTWIVNRELTNRSGGDVSVYSLCWKVSRIESCWNIIPPKPHVKNSQLKLEDLESCPTTTIEAESGAVNSQVSIWTSKQFSRVVIVIVNTAHLCLSKANVKLQQSDCSSTGNAGETERGNVVGNTPSCVVWLRQLEPHIPQ